MQYQYCKYCCAHVIFPPDVKYAEQCFKDAHEYVRKGDLKTAVALFRTAVRHNNQSEIYWNDLGVTEMRIGNFLKARRRFVKSLDLNSHFEPARDNFLDVSTHLKKNNEQLETIDMVLRRKIFEYRHKVFPVKEFSKEEFLSFFQECDVDNSHQECESESISNQKYPKLFNDPFIIRDFLSEVNNEQSFRFFELNSLVEKYRSLRVDYYPQNMVEESAHPFFLSFEPAIHQLLAPREVFENVDVSNPGTYLQINLDAKIFQEMIGHSKIDLLQILDDEKMWSSYCFQSNVTHISHFYLRHHWKMLLIGAEQASMFAHQDLLQASSFQIQLEGSKRWHLCPGNQSKFLYSPGDVDLFQPNYSKYPKLKRATCFEVTTQPGDLIFYPGDFWHQTFNHDTPTIALSSTVIVPRDVVDFIRTIEKQCIQHKNLLKDEDQRHHRDEHQGRVNKLESEICDIMLDRCFDHLQKMTVSD